MPRGSLTVHEPRELLVGRAHGNAFEPDGTVAKDTVCLRQEAAPPGDMPKPMADEEVVRVDEEQVVWGGQIVAHYGHFLCESVSRLWPLLPGGELEDLPVVFTTEKGRPLAQDLPFVRDWLDAFGVRMVELPDDGVARFTKMLVPEASWRIDAWIAPEIRDVHLHARRGLDVAPSAPHEVLWLSRQGLGFLRKPYDEALLEWLLQAQVTPVSLETMTLAEQIAALEGSRTVAGVVGSAFHTLLMTAKPPDCLYLFPPWDKASFSGQHRIIESNATFAQALAVAAWTRRARRRGVIFPFGYRLLIPETLRALSETALPGLLDDARLEAFSRPEAHWSATSTSPAQGSIDAAVARVLLDPLAIEPRMALGEIFAAEGLTRCALEQFVMVTELTEDYADAPLLAARILAGEERADEAAGMAKVALAIDPKLTEAADYANAGNADALLFRLLTAGRSLP